MFKVKFYESFGKKLNSTKRPTVSDNFTEVSVNMKTPSSIINPVIELTLTGAQVSNFRYAYIADFDRYYFINDKTFNNGFWVFSLSCDVLASWKNQISTFETVILRSSNQVNEYIPDSMVQLTGKYSFSKTDLWGSYGTTWSSGVYVLSVLGRGNAPTVRTYQMTSAQFEQFVNTLYASVTNFTWGTLVQGQINNLYNPEEKIVSCYWFPKAFSTSGSDYITCGLWNSGIKGAIIDTSYDWSSYVVSVSQHPQASSMGKYLNLSPYTQHYVEMNTGEVIRIDGSLLMDVPSVAIENKTDPLTGLAIIEGLAIHGQGITSETLFKITVPWGVPINLAVGKNNLAGFITSATESMTKTGRPMSRMVVEDYSGSYEFAFFGKDHEAFMQYEKLNSALFIEGVIDEKYYIKPEDRAAGKTSPYTLKIKDISLLGNVAESLMTGLEIYIPTEILNEKFRKELIKVIKKHKGKCPLLVQIRDKETKYNINFYSKKFAVKVNTELIAELNKLDIQYSVQKKY